MGSIGQSQGRVKNLFKGVYDLTPLTTVFVLSAKSPHRLKESFSRSMKVFETLNNFDYFYGSPHKTMRATTITHMLLHAQYKRCSGHVTNN